MYYHSTLCLFVRQHGKAAFFRDAISEPIRCNCARRILRRLILEPQFFQGDLQVVRFLSSPLQNPGSQGFSHFWPVPLAFLHVHARACLHMLRRLVRCLAPGESSSESPESPRNPRFSRESRWFCSRGGRIRTRCAMFCRVGTVRHVRKSLSPDQIFDIPVSIRYRES